jgi:hypothetical protein
MHELANVLINHHLHEHNKLSSLQITQPIEIECESVKNIEHIEKEIMQNTMKIRECKIKEAKV